MAGNLGAGSNRLKWYSLQMINRVPAVELERRLHDIGRWYAACKRDLRIEETELWDFLFDNYNVLDKSLAKHRLQDVLSGLVPLLGDRWVKEEPLPFSEVYRRFVIFKAFKSVEIFGPKRIPKRPKYKELYRKINGPKHKNEASFKMLMHNYSRQQKKNERMVKMLNTGAIILEDEDQAAPRPEKRAPTEHAQRSPTLTRSGRVQARPYHKREFTTAASGWSQANPLLPPANAPTNRAKTDIKLSAKHAHVVENTRDENVVTLHQQENTQIANEEIAVKDQEAAHDSNGLITDVEAKPGNVPGKNKLPNIAPKGSRTLNYRKDKTKRKMKETNVDFQLPKLNE